MRPALSRLCRLGPPLAAALVLIGLGAAGAAPALPEIRLSAANRVPACVTPERLMAFLKRRNGSLAPRFRDIARHYKEHGEAWSVRWDYAFFQMAVETNFLTYRRPDGRMGDVDPKQNNFAGIGTTGGGVPGDSFPDVSTGVLGQIQHLVVYSGEAVANPVAERTQLKQEHILTKSRELNRPVRFSDLARRWAADPKYGNTIAWVADQYRAEECKGGDKSPPHEAEMLPWQRKTEPAAGGARALAVADASAPVRTIWRRDPQGAAAPAKAPAKAKPAAEAEPAPSPAAAPKPAAQPLAPEPQPAARPDAAPAAPAAAPQDGAAQAPFALFAPPAGLAGATIPAAKPAAAAPAARAAPMSAPAPTEPMGPPAPPPGTAVVPPPAAETAAVAKPAFQPPSGLGVKPGRCAIETASYGGETTVLVKTAKGADVRYVALSVLDGFEAAMTQSFLASRPEGGEALGTFPSRDAALAQARTLCPD